MKSSIAPVLAAALLLSSSLVLVRVAQARDAPPRQAAAPAAPASPAAAQTDGSTTNDKPAGGNAGKPPARLDLNSADEKLLAALPGLDAAKARRIVRNRPYDSPAALVDLSIVTGKDFDKFKDLVTAGPPK